MDMDEGDTKETEEITALLEGLQRLAVKGTPSRDGASIADADIDRIVSYLEEVSKPIKRRIEAQQPSIEEGVRRYFTAFSQALLRLIPVAAQWEMRRRFDEALNCVVELRDQRGCRAEYQLCDFGGIQSEVNDRLKAAGFGDWGFHFTHGTEVPQISLDLDLPRQRGWVHELLVYVADANGLEAGRPRE